MESVFKRGAEFYRRKVGVMSKDGHFKREISRALILLVFVGIIAIAVFFIAVRGAEQTLVPDVRGKDLTKALLELQVKELYPRIQMRYSQSPHDRGQILEQDPRAGTIVKAGRRIRLVVSQGVMLNHVENYIGRNIDNVRTEIQAFFDLSGGQLIKLKEPFMYDFSPEAPGTILLQKPEPGTDISGPTEIEFVVSQGLQDTLTVPELTGLTLASALEQISKAGIAFEFSLRETQEGEIGGTVVAQNPPAGAEVLTNTPTRIMVTIPTDLKENEVFGLFTYTMPLNPYPLPVRLEAQPPGGKMVSIFSLDYQGGKFNVPYRLPPDSVLILTMMDRELYRETVRQPIREAY